MQSFSPSASQSISRTVNQSVSQSVSLKMVSLADPSFWHFLVGESRTRLIYQSLQRLRGTFTVNGRRKLRISPNFEQIKIVSTNSLDENNEKLLICCRSKEQLKTSEGKTWWRRTNSNSRLPRLARKRDSKSLGFYSVGSWTWVIGQIVSFRFNNLSLSHSVRA